MRRSIGLSLFVLLGRAAVAQTQPDVAEILRSVAKTYKVVSQYEFVVDANSHAARDGTDGAAHAHFAFKAPDRYRIEGAIPGMSLENSPLSEALIVYDGSAVWFYLPKSN